MRFATEVVGTTPRFMVVLRLLLQELVRTQIELVPLVSSRLGPARRVPVGQSKSPTPLAQPALTAVAQNI